MHYHLFYMRPDTGKVERSIIAPQDTLDEALEICNDGDYPEMRYFPVPESELHLWEGVN